MGVSIPSNKLIRPMRMPTPAIHANNTQWFVIPWHMANAARFPTEMLHFSKLSHIESANRGSCARLNGNFTTRTCEPFCALATAQTCQSTHMAAAGVCDQSVTETGNKQHHIKFENQHAYAQKSSSSVISADNILIYLPPH